MPYSVIETMYKSLNAEKQAELYDYLCFLVSQKDNVQYSPPVKNSHPKDFFSLFGSISDPTFKEPEDAPVCDNEDELF